jgi:hypothetical protein
MRNNMMILDGCWRDITWLNTDVDILYVKRINLNDFYVLLE